MSHRDRWPWILGSLITIGFLAHGQSSAQQKAEIRSTRIAVLDIVKVFNEYEQTKELNSKFEEARQVVQIELQKKQENIQNLGKQLQAYDSSHPDYKTIRDQVLRAQVDGQVYAEVKKQDLQEKHKEWLEKTYHNIADHVTKLATSQGIDIVITYEELDASEATDSNALRQQIVRRKVIYANPMLDLTDTVLQALNSEFRLKGGIKVQF
jgi:Skp family chaperone for outer membrane proteins